MAERKRAINRDYGDDRFSIEEASLFRQPDVLCVEEYLHVYRAKPAETPERRLLAALLSDAIDSYLRDCCIPNRRKRNRFRETEQWFFSTDDYGVFSFENVCEVLTIEPGYIRRGLISYEQQNLPQPKLRVVAREPARTDLRLAS